MGAFENQNQKKRHNNASGGIRAISQKTIQEAIELLKKAVNPVKIVSWARGDITEDRDLDFLIIEKEVKVAGGGWMELRTLPPFAVEFGYDYLPAE